MLAADRRGAGRIRHPRDATLRVARSRIRGSDLRHGMVPDTRIGATGVRDLAGVAVAPGGRR